MKLFRIPQSVRINMLSIPLSILLISTLVGRGRIELPTSVLSGQRSTTELPTQVRKRNYSLINEPTDYYFFLPLTIFQLYHLRIIFHLKLFKNHPLKKKCIIKIYEW